MNRLGLVSVAEPFAGLFTQGMVCHETYKDASGNWVSPDDVEKSGGGKAFLRDTGLKSKSGLPKKISKSKKNVIAPEEIDDVYGADAIRWFMLSDTPPERGVEWTDAGAEGCWRFVQRIWRLAGEAENLSPIGTIPKADDEISKTLRQAAHKTIACNPASDLNPATLQPRIGPLYMLANAIADGEKADGAARREAIEALMLLSAPMMPHQADPAGRHWATPNWRRRRPGRRPRSCLAQKRHRAVAVQVNGKRRGEVTVALGADNKTVEAAALADDGVIRALAGAPPRKVIVVPNRIVNIVV